MVTSVIQERRRKRLEKLRKTKEVMKKLNKSKIRWIIKEMKLREISVYQIAKQQKINKRHVWRLYKRYLKEGEMPFLKPCGRRPKEISEAEVNLVKKTHEENQGAGAVNIERILKERGINIPHNRIHKILINEGLSREQPKKKNRRKWIRYERKHSLSLVHTDWLEYGKKQIILYEDDASRLITGYGEFRNATTENSIKVFDESVEDWGTPKQVMSDHGTQFCANEDKVYEFEEHLKSKGVKLIKARVKHPQSNGKIERLVFTIKRLLDRGLSLDKSVKFYNEKRFHMSLENGHLRTPLQAFNEKKHNS
jgi:putative transposase